MLPNIGFIESYGLMMTLGVAASFLVFEIYFRKHLKEKDLKINYLEISLLVAVMAGLVGSYLFQNVYNFIEDPAHYKWTWSLTFYGGIISGVIGFFLMWFAYAKKHYPEGLSKLIVVAPGSITTAHAIGRMGCFMAGCCYGIETDAWYGVTFPGMTHKVIPTNLFESIFLMLLSVCLIWMAFKKDSKLTFPVYLISYGIWRFLIEFVRGDHRGSFVPGLTPSQFWSVLILIGGVGWLVFEFFFKKKIRTK